MAPRAGRFVDYADHDLLALPLRAIHVSLLQLVAVVAAQPGNLAAGVGFDQGDVNLGGVAAGDEQPVAGLGERDGRRLDHAGAAIVELAARQFGRADEVVALGGEVAAARIGERTGQVALGDVPGVRGRLRCRSRTPAGPRGTRHPFEPGQANALQVAHQRGDVLLPLW